MDPVNGHIGQNTVQGSIKMVNIHYQGMQLDGTQNNENCLSRRVEVDELCNPIISVRSVFLFL